MAFSFRAFFLITAIITATWHPLLAQRFIRDSSWAGTGALVTQRGLNQGYPHTQARQIIPLASGKFLLTISRQSSFPDAFEMGRVTVAGTPDSTFGTNGYATVNYSVGGGAIMGYGIVAEQLGGKLLVLGRVSTSTQVYGIVVRLNANGSLDQTFGTNGVRTLAQPSISAYTYPTSILAQPDGKIIIGGEYYVSTNYNKFMMTRLNADGSYDNSFGQGGVAIGSNPSLQNIASYPRDFQVQADGKIIFVGWARNQSNPGGSGGHPILLARYKSNGTPDSTFGNQGYVYRIMDSFFVMPSFISAEANGDILIGGLAERIYSVVMPVDSTVDRPYLAKFSSSGALMTSFGQGGQLQLRRPAMAVRQTMVVNGSGTFPPVFLKAPNGRILVASHADTFATRHLKVCALLPSTGRLDSSFCDSGILYIPRGKRDLALAGAMMADGRFIIGGSTLLNQPTGSSISFADSLAPLWIRLKPQTTSPQRVPLLATASDGLSLYPNPAPGTGFNIVLGENWTHDEPLRARLYSIDGRSIIEQVWPARVWTKTLAVEPSHALSPGLYILRVESGNRRAATPVQISD